MNSYGNSEIGSSIICPYCGKEYEPSCEDGEWKGDSERMDTKNGEKKFLRALFDKFIEEIEIVG